LAAGTEAGRYRLIAVLFLPLYTRLHKEELLDNEKRGMIRGAVAADPGIHYSELLRRLDLSNGNAAHHLQALERDGFIWSRSDGRLKRFYPAGMRLAQVPVSLNRLQAAIFETLSERDGLSKTELARALEASFPTVHRHVNRMADMGVLRLERRGLSVRCHIADEWKGARRNGRALERAPAAPAEV
jgi:predicted transcriptional regulator